MDTFRQESESFLDVLCSFQEPFEAILMLTVLGIDLLDCMLECWIFCDQVPCSLEGRWA